MTNSQRLATVSACLLGWLTTSQASSATCDSSDVNAVIVKESILIRDEFYCGRRLHTATHSAVWFMEEDELKIFDLDGNLVASLSGDEIDSGANLAADGGPEVIKMSDATCATPSDRTESGTGDCQAGVNEQAGDNDATDGEIRRAA